LETTKIKELFKEIKDKYNLWDVIEQLDELDRSDEPPDLKQYEIANLLLTTKQLKTRKKHQRNNSLVLNTEDNDNEITIFNFTSEEERKSTLERIYKEGIGITDNELSPE